MSRAFSALGSFLALSEAMVSAAEAQEWEEFIRLSEERAALSSQLPDDLSKSMTAAEQGQGRTIIERCLQLDAQTRTLVEERKHALSILLREPLPTP